VLRGLDPVTHRDALLAALADGDAWIRHAAAYALSQKPDALVNDDWRRLESPEQRLGVLHALKWSDRPKARPMAVDFLNDADARVRFSALRWIADERLSQHRERLLALIDSPDLTEELFIACVSALDRLDNEKVNDWPNPEFLAKNALDDQAPVRARRLCLALLRPDYKGLKLANLKPLSRHPDRGIRLEAVRLIAAMNDPRRFALLAELAVNPAGPAAIRAEAVAGLAADAEQHVRLLLDLADGDDRTLREESLRALIGVTFDDGQRSILQQIGRRDPAAAEAVARVLGEPLKERPSPDDLAAWLALADGPGDADAGRRIFSHTKIGSCLQCHGFNGRGNRVGPDLSRVAARDDRRWLLESIVDPSREIAPQFIPWEVTTTDGEAHTLIAMRKGGEREVYADVTGREITFTKKQIASVQQLATSLMPAGLAETLTVQELRDLLAFLTRPDRP
jgi:putative heme-binding domain-containing protein